MGTMAFMLVLGSGLVNAIWHLLAKQSVNKFAFLWWVQVVALIAYFPLMWHGVSAISVSLTAAMFIAGTVVVHGGSVLCLAKMYTHGDFSLAYPVARGIAPLTIIVLAVLFIGERVSMELLAALLLIVVGIYVSFLHQLSFTTLLQPLKRILHIDGRWALMTGLFIAAYSVWDKLALQHAPSPVVNWAGNLGNFLFLIPLARLHVKHEWQQQKGRLIAAGVMSSGAYLLFLMANTLAPLVRTAGVRELGIIASALLGSMFLKEPFGRERIFGSVLIASGVVLLTVLR